MMLSLALALLAQDVPSPQARYEESFEDRQSLDVVYDRWERERGPGHPPYNDLAVDRDPDGARAGRHLLRLSTHGGAVALRMAPRHPWRIDPARPYRLSVFARMSRASRNAAVASVEWLDRDYAPLRRDVSAPLPPAEAWTEITLDIPFPPADAQWARLGLEYGGPDVRGDCRFDLLTLMQATRLDIQPADRSLPIFAAGAPIRLRVAAYGLDPVEHRLLLRTSSHAAAPVAIFPGRPCVLELPPHAPGHHEIALEIEGSPIRGAGSILVPNPRLGRPAGPRWIGVSIPPGFPHAAELAAFAGFDRVRLESAQLAPETLVRALGAADHSRITGIVPKDVEDARRLRTLAARHAGGVEAWEVDGLRYASELLLDPASVPTAVPARAELLRPSSELLRTLIDRAASGDRPEAVFVPIDVPLSQLAALRVANDLLTDARVRSEVLPLLNVQERVFDKEGRLLLVFWNETETEREAHFGAGAVVVPPLGAARPHVPGERLKIGPTPLFVARVDAEILETQSGLQFYDPERPGAPDARIPLGARPVTRLLKYKNLSRDEALTDVRIRLVPPFPPGWQIRPLELRAARIGPLEEATLETLLVLPTGAEEQTRDLSIELAYRKQDVERRALLSRTLEATSVIGIEIQAEGRTLSVRFRNRGSRPLNFLARARLPGLPAREEAVGPLEPGAVRGWDFPAAPEAGEVEVVAEERGGERAYARKRLALP